MSWNKKLRLMRLLCPLAMLMATALGLAAWRLEQYVTMAVDAFLAGFNLMLTWVQFRVFQYRVTGDK